MRSEYAQIINLRQKLRLDIQFQSVLRYTASQAIIYMFTITRGQCQKYVEQPVCGVLMHVPFLVLQPAKGGEPKLKCTFQNNENRLPWPSPVLGMSLFWTLIVFFHVSPSWLTLLSLLFPQRHFLDDSRQKMHPLLCVAKYLHKWVITHYHEF